MRRLFAKRWLRFVVGLTAALLVSAIAVCWKCRVWTVNDYRLCGYLAKRYPFGRDLWYGTIGPGHPADQFVNLYPPHATDRYGRFTSLSYYSGGPLGPGELPFEGEEIVVKDGRLVRAWAASCTWDRKFFDMNTADTAEYEQLRKQIIDEHYQRYREKLGSDL